MTTKTALLALAIVTGFSLPALAERGPGGQFPRPSFSELDADGDGLVTAEELRGAGAARFAAADSNGDGELSQEEMVAAAQKRAAEAAPARAERMIERLDADGNGTLSQAELEARGPGRMVDRMIERLDEDGDGALSEAEFAAAKERWGGKKHHKGWGQRQN